VLVAQENLNNAPWRSFDTEAVNVAPSVYEQAQHADSVWQPVATEQLQQYPATRQLLRTVTAPQDARRPMAKNGVPRVPATYHERQEKAKVSKRKGPLTESQRQKTHKMRKDKSTCFRCRFYKVGVYYTSFMNADIVLTESSAAQAVYATHVTVC
jgi:hypothetical protein